MRATVVVGYGVTGRAVARVLSGRGRRVVVVDDRPEAVAEAAAAGLEAVTTPGSGDLATVMADAADVVVSPGVPTRHPALVAAEAAGVGVASEIELAWRLGAGADVPRLVAITGTNGKTTVTTLVTAALRRSGVTAVAAGNIGLPLVEALVPGSTAVVVAEVSSFQLHYTERFRPAVSCWLNLSADHLDWHPTPQHYRDAKARIWARQGPGDVAVVNADDPEVVRAAGRRPEGVALVDFSLGPTASWHQDRDVLVGPDGVGFMAVADLSRALPHDRANALAAAAVAVEAGASLEAVVSTLAEGVDLPHRVSRVATTGDDVVWYDDSKATTPASVLAAVAGFASVVLIAGGRNKGLDLAPLGGAAPPVHAVVAIGDAAGEIAAAFTGRVPVTRAASMADAVAAAAAAARPGDAVVLSPGCTSFDWYRSYAERGDDFARCVRELTGA